MCCGDRVCALCRNVRVDIFNSAAWCLVFCFFKQKTAYEMLRSLVGSEMCIETALDGGGQVGVIKKGDENVKQRQNQLLREKRLLHGLSLIHI